MALELCHSHRSGGFGVAVGVVKTPAQQVPAPIRLIFHMMNPVYRGVQEALVQLSSRHGYYKESIDSQLLIGGVEIERGDTLTSIDLVCGSAGSKSYSFFSKTFHVPRAAASENWSFLIHLGVRIGWDAEGRTIASKTAMSDQYCRRNPNIVLRN